MEFVDKETSCIWTTVEISSFVTLEICTFFISLSLTNAEACFSSRICSTEEAINPASSLEMMTGSKLDMDLARGLGLSGPVDLSLMRAMLLSSLMVSWSSPPRMTFVSSGIWFWVSSKASMKLMRLQDFCLLHFVLDEFLKFIRAR